MVIILSFIFIINADAAENLNNDMKERMKNWSRQLGVTCVYCHNIDNFKDDSKQSYKTSLKHYQMTKVIQEDVFNKRDQAGILKVKVDCYMCHRGEDKPSYNEPPLKLIK